MIRMNEACTQLEWRFGDAVSHAVILGTMVPLNAFGIFMLVTPQPKELIANFLVVLALMNAMSVGVVSYRRIANLEGLTTICGFYRRFVAWHRVASFTCRHTEAWWQIRLYDGYGKVLASFDMRERDEKQRVGNRLLADFITARLAGKQTHEAK